jgi:hypothetical protein
MLVKGSFEDFFLHPGGFNLGWILNIQGNAKKEIATINGQNSKKEIGTGNTNG